MLYDLFKIKAGMRQSMKNFLLSDPEIEDGLILHSQNLFKMNNLIIQECNIQKTRFFKMICAGAIFCASTFAFYKYF